jgi:hemerythrin-like domain-containing protein
MSRSLHHDHTELDVLFENLDAAASLALGGQTDPELLDDAFLQWQNIQSEIEAHFSREEQGLFLELAVCLSHQRELLANLIRQHSALRRLLLEVGSLLNLCLTEDSPQRQGVEQRLRELRALWRAHADYEWQLIQEAEAIEGHTITPVEEQKI